MPCLLQQLFSVQSQKVSPWRSIVVRRGSDKGGYVRWGSVISISVVTVRASDHAVLAKRRNVGMPVLIRRYVVLNRHMIILADRGRAMVHPQLPHSGARTSSTVPIGLRLGPPPEPAFPLPELLLVVGARGFVAEEFLELFDEPHLGRV